MSNRMLSVIWLAALAVAAYLYLRRTYSRFARAGVRHPAPLPVLGNMGSILLRREHFVDHLDSQYRRFADDKFYGRYEFLNQMLVVKDLELIKKVTVKDFEHFLDHRSIIDENTDPLFGRNLFSLKGQEWKDMRATLSPAFTSSKIRVMIPFMDEVGEQMIKVLKQKIQSSKNGFVDVDIKDLTTRYANDVVASCAFGLKVDSQTDENNQFYLRGKEASTFSFKQILMFFGFANFPKLMQALNITLFSSATKVFFKRLIMDTMQDREEKHIVRPDMIHLLMEAKKGKLTHEKSSGEDAGAGFATVEEAALGRKDVHRDWSEDDLVAQAVLFFIAGFETVSSAMSFLIHELALNPDVQARLYREVRAHDDAARGRLDYSSIQNLAYLDMVVSEVLRLWPPAIAMDRVCIKDYNIGRPNDKATKDFIVPRGMGLNIPVWSIHRDAAYFPDPLRFDPERFSDENKHNIQPFTYMPFGLGPRNCIGSRFALCELKMMVYQLLRAMEVSPCERTCVPSRLSKDTFNLRLEGGHWVRMRARD